MIRDITISVSNSTLEAVLSVGLIFNDLGDVDQRAVRSIMFPLSRKLDNHLASCQQKALNRITKSRKSQPEVYKIKLKYHHAWAWHKVLEVQHLFAPGIYERNAVKIIKDLLHQELQ